MAEIRPFERSDLSAVATLLRANLPPWTTDERVPESLAGAFLDAPWTDPAVPSLVAADDAGAIIGFIGCQPRRFLLGDRTLRGVCPSHLAVDPERRGGAAGALLLRRLLTAGQDFTYADTANEEVVRMWQAFGGQLDGARACNWMLLLRPGRWLRRQTATRLLGRSGPGPEVPVRAIPFDALRPGSGSGLPERKPDAAGEDVDAAAIVELQQGMGRAFDLRPDYDQGWLEHLFARIDAELASPVCRRVRRGDHVLGWYVYVPQPGGVSRVLALVVTGADDEAVLGDLLASVREREGLGVVGRLEPHLIRSLHELSPLLAIGQQTMVHSHDPAISATLAGGRSLLTRLDGEWFVP
jgi:GNAT superfamily N-acetyltransferase